MSKTTKEIIATGYCNLQEFLRFENGEAPYVSELVITKKPKVGDVRITLTSKAVISYDVVVSGEQR